MSLIKTLICLVVGIVISLESYASDVVYTATVKDGKIIKSDEFFCTDSIYVFVESSGGSIDLSGSGARIEWKDPSGILVRSANSDFKKVNPSSAYLWDGLKFTPNSGFSSNVGMFLLGPSEVLGDVIGGWQVTVYLAENQVHTEKFTVIC